MSGAYESHAARDADALALVTAAITGDSELMAYVLRPLTHEQVVAILCVVAGWFAWAMREDPFDDPLDHVRRVAQDLAERVEGLTDE
jgi:hypothetical protein